MTANIHKVKDRIAKLSLRMADDAGSPGNEAAIAATRARKLMDQYQLRSEAILTMDFPKRSRS